MMKLGCMSLSFQDMKIEEFIQTVYDLGLDVIEFHSRAFASTDPDYLREIKRQCMKHGLPIGYLGISNSFGKPEAELPEEVDLVKEWIDVAAFMGIPLVRIFAAYLPPGVEDEAPFWPPMIRCMKEVAVYGAEKGVMVGLQNHNHNNLTHTGEEVLRILREVNHPYFSHILDTGQYVGSPGASGQRGKPDPRYDFYGSIEQTAPYAVYVRTKLYRMETGEEAWLDYPRIFRILKGVGYNGCLSIVYEGEEESLQAIKKGVTYLRSLLRV